jgi:hypothetical protein
MGRTKQELLTEMDRRRATLCEGVSPGDYLQACVRIMFEVAAETLAGETARDRRDNRNPLGTVPK